MLKFHESNNYQVVYDGPLGARYLNKLKQQFQSLKADKKKIGLIAEVDKIPGVKGLRSLLELTRMKVAALGVIRKYAILTSKKWMEKMAKIADWMTPGIQVRVFPKENAQLALAWLEEEPSQKE